MLCLGVYLAYYVLIKLAMPPRAKGRGVCCGTSILEMGSLGNIDAYLVRSAGSAGPELGTLAACVVGGAAGGVGKMLGAEGRAENLRGKFRPFKFLRRASSCSRID